MQQVNELTTNDEQRTHSTGSSNLNPRRDLLASKPLARSSSALNTNAHARLRNPPANAQPNLRASTTTRTPAFTIGNTRTPSFTIRGTAAAQTGPFVVIASNFAPGTTAADIKSSLEGPIGGEVLACKLLKLNPVMCEVVFKERAGAENVIAMYHNNWVSFWCFSLAVGLLHLGGGWAGMESVCACLAKWRCDD